MSIIGAKYMGSVFALFSNNLLIALYKSVV